MQATADAGLLIVAGSVVATEEPLALIAFGVVQGDFREALLVLAPRKPERFAAAAEFIDDSHRKFIRRSELAVAGPGDTSEWQLTTKFLRRDCLAARQHRRTCFTLSNARTECSLAVHWSPPAATTFWSLRRSAKCPSSANSMENFAEIAARFVEAKAAIQVRSPEDAGVEWIHLLKDPEKMERMGEVQLVNWWRAAGARWIARLLKT